MRNINKVLLVIASIMAIGLLVWYFFHLMFEWNNEMSSSEETFLILKAYLSAAIGMSITLGAPILFKRL